MDTKTITNKLLSNPKIKQISFLVDHSNQPYVAIVYIDKLGYSHDILLDFDDLHLLLHPFTISSINKQTYVKLHLPTGSIYLHQAIAEPPQDCVSHHVFSTIDNRRSALQVVDRATHSRFHRLLRVHNIQA